MKRSSLLVALMSWTMWLGGAAMMTGCEKSRTVQESHSQTTSESQAEPVVTGDGGR